MKKRGELRLGLLTMVFGITLLTYSVSVQNSWSMDQKGYKNIAVDELVEMMNQKDFTLINVHVPYEGEIPETDLLIPFDAIGEYKDKLPQGKDAKIVVYCMAGPMGVRAARKLADLGYTQVLHLQGGMRAWERSGRKLEFRSQ